MPKWPLQLRASELASLTGRAFFAKPRDIELGILQRHGYLTKDVIQHTEIKRRRLDVVGRVAKVAEVNVKDLGTTTSKGDEAIDKLPTPREATTIIEQLRTASKTKALTAHHVSTHAIAAANQATIKAAQIKASVLERDDQTAKAAEEHAVAMTAKAKVAATVAVEACKEAEQEWPSPTEVVADLKSQTSCYHGIAKESEDLYHFDAVGDMGGMMQLHRTTSEGTPYIIAGKIDGRKTNPDGSETIVECKRRMKRHMNRVPTYEMPQLQAYMAMTDTLHAVQLETYDGVQKVHEVEFDDVYWNELMNQVDGAVDRLVKEIESVL